MKRRVLKLAVLLLLGAIVNVAVAWGCCSYFLPRSTRNLESLEAHELWRSHLPLTWPQELPADDSAGMTTEDRGPGVTVCYIVLRGKELPTGTEMFFVNKVLAGWPFRIASGIVYYDLVEVVATKHAIVTTWGTTHVLPYGPIWPGFAINTVFYAGVLWLLFAAPLALRRRRRIKRGLCPKCAYDLRGSDSQTCPECGATVNRIAR